MTRMTSAGHVLLHNDSMAFDPQSPTWETWLQAAGANRVDAARGPRFGQPDHALQAANRRRGGWSWAGNTWPRRTLRQADWCYRLNCSSRSVLLSTWSTPRRMQTDPNSRIFGTGCLDETSRV